MPTLSPEHSSERLLERPRMLVCDLDGTLLNSKGVMTEATVAALRLAVEEGVEIVFATGRRHNFAWKVLESVQLHDGTVLISSNGAITRTLAGEHRQRLSMPVETALLLCRQLKSFRDSLIFTFERTGPGALVVENIDALHARIPRWVDSNAHEIECFVPLERAFEGGDEPVQAMICGTLQQMKEALLVLDDPAPAAMRLRSGLAIHRTEYALRDLSIVDLMPYGCSKGNAIATLAAERGMDASDVACIGDNMNDADMLAYAGMPVVMKNAPAGLLAMAAANGWAVTGSNDEDGAAQAILRMLEGPARTVADVEQVVVPAI
ncbi:MAG: HAD hydrolase family protein [Acidobacteriaceae bacterium]